MSPQLTISSLFSALALACLCVVAISGDIVGGAGSATADMPFAAQAELSPSLRR